MARLVAHNVSQTNSSYKTNEEHKYALLEGQRCQLVRRANESVTIYR